MKNPMAPRLLNSLREGNSVKRQIFARIKSLLEEVDMALYDRSAGIGFIYNNFGDLVKKIQTRENLRNSKFMKLALERKNPELRKDSLVQLRENVSRLQEMHGRLQFMLKELEGLVKKSS